VYINKIWPYQMNLIFQALLPIPPMQVDFINTTFVNPRSSFSIFKLRFHFSVFSRYGKQLRLNYTQNLGFNQEWLKQILSLPPKWHKSLRLHSTWIPEESFPKRPDLFSGKARQFQISSRGTRVLNCRGNVFVSWEHTPMITRPPFKYYHKRRAVAAL